MEVLLLVRVTVMVAVGLVLCARTFGKDPREEAGAEQVVENLAKVQKGWGPKMNSPGVAISLKEISRRKVGDHRAVIYRLVGSGFSKEKSYSITTTPLDLQPTTILEGVTLDGLGQAVCAGRPGTCRGDSPNDPVDLTLFAAKGEPKRFALISGDGQSKAFAYVIPFPILGVDRGCSVEVILLTQGAEAVLIHGSGFDPNSDVGMVATSEGETRQRDLKVGDDGDFWEVGLAYVKGKSKGTARVTLKSKTCGPSVSYDWGKDSYQIQ
jgi:hypothetical protein